MRLAWTGEVEEGAEIPFALYTHVTEVIEQGWMREGCVLSFRRFLLPIPIPWRTDITSIAADSWLVGLHFPCITIVKYNMEPPAVRFLMYPWTAKLVSTSYEQQRND